MEKSAPMKYSQIKHRIKRSQAQAKALGFFFLLGTLAVAVLACLPLATVNGATLGVVAFWKPFATLFSGNVLANFKANTEAVLVAVLYAIMLLSLLINVIRSLTKLGWLFKSKASKLYGFNRNMYAMDGLAKIFSASFNCVIAYHLLIALVTGGIALSLLGYIALAFGVVWHLLLTPFTGNVSLYTTENGITEEKREVGNFAPIFRNVLQLVALGGIIFFFVKYVSKTDVLGNAIATLVERGAKAFVDVPGSLIVPAICLVLTFFIIGMSAYVFGVKEYDSEGAKERGRKTNLVLSLFVFFITVAVYVVGLILKKGQITNELIYVALIALGMFILEILLCKYPRVPVENADEVSVDEYLKKDEEKYGEQKNDQMVTPFYPYPFFPQLPSNVDKK